MPAVMSNYLSNKLANATLRNTSYSSPAAVYVALYSTAPTASTAGTELSGNSYSRQSVTFSAPSAGSASSNVTVSFGPATGNNWPTSRAMAIVDAATGGNILYFQTTTSQNVLIGKTLTYESGNITITLS
jgi:hypothetical protein